MSLEHILLGMLREPASGYDLKAAFDETARFFWSAELSQIYPTLQRLERLGLLRSKRQPSPSGPPRRVYHRTAAGTKALRRWLKSEPEMNAQRVPYIAQLIHLGELKDCDTTLDFLAQLSEQFEAFADVLNTAAKEFEEMGDGDPATSLNDVEFHEFLCVKMGVEVAQARIRACDAATKAVKRRIKKQIKQGAESHAISS